MKKILIVDDDKSLRHLMKEALCDEYDVLEAYSIEEAKLSAGKDIALYLLDMHLPDGNGHDFCKWIRQRYNAGIIFITVENDEEILVKCLEDGGDDYIRKPFSLVELKSRIHANLRRLDTNEGNRIVIGKYTLQKDSHAFYIDDAKVSISYTEYMILEALMQANGRLLTRESLLSYWDANGNFVEDNTLSVAISRLKRKVMDADGYCPIETIRGIGYRFKV